MIPTRPAEPEAAVDNRFAVRESAYLLGYAGLLPQAVALASTLFGGIGRDFGPLFAFGYANLLLSFVGGSWWGFAMCAKRRQGEIAMVAVIPSIVAAAVILLVMSNVVTIGLALVLTGSGVLAALLVDRQLELADHAPTGWMSLRTPLSLTLGAMTILTGIVAAFG